METLLRLVSHAGAWLTFALPDGMTRPFRSRNPPPMSLAGTHQPFPGKKSLIAFPLESSHRHCV